MRCNKCEDTITTAADVHACNVCRTDGTANEIPKDMERSAKIEAVLERKPGLGARFVPVRGATPAAAEVVQELEAANEAVDVAEKQDEAKSEDATDDTEQLDAHGIVEATDIERGAGAEETGQQAPK